MKRIRYNLAARRKINAPAFALILAAIGLAALLLSAAAAFNLARQHERRRAENGGTPALNQRLERLQDQEQRQHQAIVLLKKSWQRPLTFANRLIARKAFSFIARLDFLEKACSAGMRVRQLSLANDVSGRMQMIVSALAQNELLAFYKKLLPFGLVIAGENQLSEYYQASLSIRIPDEKK